MKKTNLIIGLLLVCSQLGITQSNFDKDKLDKYFNTLEQNNKFMGSVAVSKNGEIIYTKSIGFADVEHKVKATKHSIYKIGSISKSFTAVLVLQAVEQNKLALDQTIDKWFPTITNAKKITIHHLLNHRSGIHNFTENKDYFTWNTQPKTEKEIIEVIVKGGSDFIPDSSAEYSNSNYVLLTYILEKTLDKTYAHLLQEHIVEPLHLSNTYVFNNINPSINECKSYKFLGSWNIETETHYTVPLGAGSISSTSIDLTTFADALFSGKLLTRNSLAIMKTIKDNYGTGLFQIPFYNKIGYGHTGGIDGFSSVYAHFPTDHISYVLTSNGSNVNNNDISIAVLSAVYGKPYEIPTFTTYSHTSIELDKYLGVYASEQVPLKITITKKENTLIAQGTGQPAIPLETIEKNKFKFDQVGATFEFDPINKTMILLQGGGRIKFMKE